MKNYWIEVKAENGWKKIQNISKNEIKSSLEYWRKNYPKNKFRIKKEG